MQASAQVKQIYDQMNRLGQKKCPFVFAINYDQTKGFILENPLEQQEVLFSIGQYSNVAQSQINIDYGKEAHLEVQAISFEQYERKFQRIQNALLHGDSFLANLTIQTDISTNLNFKEIFHRASSKYKLCLPNNFVCFSPERFVFIDSDARTIKTCPMKGTIDARTPNAEHRILEDYKETAEHFTIVDLMRNDLARVGYNVEVKDFRYIDRVQTQEGELLQVSSLIQAELEEDQAYQFGTIFEELLPAGSISGAPKEATVRAIAEAEEYQRDYYTGVMGYFDGKILDSAVLIRFIQEREGGKMKYCSGGGITINSSAEEEYQEAIKKVYLPF